MATLDQLLVEQFLEGQKLRQGQIRAGEAILPAAAGQELANVEQLGPLNRANAVAGANLKGTQLGLAQRFLQGGHSFPLDPGARETLESGLKQQLRANQGIAGGDSGVRRDADLRTRIGHTIGRAGLVNEANKRGFSQLTANLDPGLKPVPTPVANAGINVASGGNAGLSQAASQKFSADQRSNELLLAAINSIGEALPSVFDIIF